MTMQIHIPFPPSANSLWVRAKKGMRRSDSYMQWLTDAGWHVKSQKPGSILGPYKLSVQAARPDRRRRDLDNLLKPISDLLQSLGIIENDSDCEMITARWVTVGHGVTVLIDKAGVE
jgi:crossover junction endodeoxyribonuclease RusA